MTSTTLVGSTFFGVDLRKLSERLQGMLRQVSKRVLLLEFDQSSLRLAEARFLGGGLQVDHLTRFELPVDALERGVPSDPAKMGGLIKQLCREKQISVHRSAVVLPTEVAFQRFIDLPAGLNPEEARDYLLDPANGLQIPIALAQADFDLQPTLLPVSQSGDERMQTYLLTAIPSNLLDQVMETLQAADLELQALEVGGISQLRLIAADLFSLKQSEVRLVLELKSECTHFSLVSASGPLCFERLAAIREFPDPVLTEEQMISVLEEGVLAEQVTINQENYLAIGDLDLRVLISELKEALKRFSSHWSGFRLVEIILTGRNSAHPFLPALIKAEFDCSVRALEPILSPGIEGLQFDSVFAQKSLNRILGLGLGLLPSDYLLSRGESATQQQDVTKSSIPLIDISQDSDSLIPIDQSVDERFPDQNKNEIQTSHSINSSAGGDRGLAQEHSIDQIIVETTTKTIEQDLSSSEVAIEGQSVVCDSSPLPFNPPQNSLPNEFRSEDQELHGSTQDEPQVAESSEWPSIRDSDVLPGLKLSSGEQSLEEEQFSSLSLPTSDDPSVSRMPNAPQTDQQMTDGQEHRHLSENQARPDDLDPMIDDEHWPSISEVGTTDVPTNSQSLTDAPKHQDNKNVASNESSDPSDENSQEIFIGELKFGDDT